MTFCGDLPFVPSGIHHHLFENLRRKGHHCHGRKRLSRGTPGKGISRRTTKQTIIRAAVIRVRTGGKRE
ncbi:hypothetical protein DUM86_20590 [Shigella sonnei]|nr:hypothetical protein [Shigella sonnei]EGD4852906.1 hypothetical protein [Shigella sonnei]